MKKNVSSSRHRYLAVWFPFLPTDRLRRADHSDKPVEMPADKPVVVVEKIKGALRLSAVDAPALALGLTPGLTLADARARMPGIRAVHHRPDADAALLARVLEDFGRFSPVVARDGKDGLILDVTGCAHLFGGEADLVALVRRRAECIGLGVRVALAGTPETAHALSRFGVEGIVAPDRDRQAARLLPIAALELPEREGQALLRTGLKTLGDLDDRNGTPLAARFGSDFAVRLGRVLGLEDIRIAPSRLPAPCVVERVLAEPVTGTEDVEHVLMDLLIQAAYRLDQRGLGGRAFEAMFFRVDGDVRRVAVRTSRLSRDASGLMRLFQERLGALAAPLDAGFGFDRIRLSVAMVQPLSAVQRRLEGGPCGERPGAEDVSLLIDRLTARLGRNAVLRFEPCDEHIPERASRMALADPASNDDWLKGGGWPALDPADPPLRPLQLFDLPQPIDTLAVVPDGAPLRFRWRRVLHEVACAEGPERIADQWWRDPAQNNRQRTRDYYRVEDRDGRRFWLFRDGLYGKQPEPLWYIHGLFA